MFAVEEDNQFLDGEGKTIKRNELFTEEVTVEEGEDKNERR